ncbi:MAG: hypothetical protein K0Q49_21 [Haloplasmataceae bacterium]|jgi:AcrR family transcriptional regulator|nr:hypothetical protein [Haloplasmataceae bacterium]
MRITKPPEERKQEILATSRRLFEQNGFENTKISDIVKEIGVAKGLFYYYFKSKEELIKAIIEQYKIELEIKIKSILSNEEGGFYQKILLFTDMYSNQNELLLLDEQLIHEIIDSKSFEIDWLVHLKKLIEIGVNEKKLNIKYPIETTIMMFYGLKYLLEHPKDMNINRFTYLTMIEQTLHLPMGVLTK